MLSGLKQTEASLSGGTEYTVGKCATGVVLSVELKFIDINRLFSISGRVVLYAVTTQNSYGKLGSFQDNLPPSCTTA
jgi:hypothetical protein